MCTTMQITTDSLTFVIITVIVTQTLCQLGRCSFFIASEVPLTKLGTCELYTVVRAGVFGLQAWCLAIHEIPPLRGVSR